MQASALSSAASASQHAMASPQGHGRSSRYARWAQAWGSARHAYLLTALGRLDDASKELRQALASAPDSPERAMWMTDLGHLSALLGKHDNHGCPALSVEYFSDPGGCGAPLSICVLIRQWQHALYSLGQGGSRRPVMPSPWPSAALLTLLLVRGLAGRPSIGSCIRRSRAWTRSNRWAATHS